MKKGVLLLLAGLVLRVTANLSTPANSAPISSDWRRGGQQGINGALSFGRDGNPATWLVKHMQWDFDDIDPVFPLSPFFRFEHKVNLPWKLFTEDQQSVTFTTTVHPTRPHASVATSYRIFPWVVLQGSLGTLLQFPKPLEGILSRAGMELSIPLDHVTDPALNNALANAQSFIGGDEVPLIGQVKNKLIVGLGTAQEPTVGVASTVAFGQKQGGFAGIRTRVSTTRHGSVTYSLAAF